MSHSDVIAARFLVFDQMYGYERRLQTFADWPFREDCQCTPELVSLLDGWSIKHICIKAALTGRLFHSTS